MYIQRYMYRDISIDIGQYNIPICLLNSIYIYTI